MQSTSTQPALISRLKALALDLILLLCLHLAMFICLMVLSKTGIPEDIYPIIGDWLIFNIWSVPLLGITFFEWRDDTSFGKKAMGMHYEVKPGFQQIRYALRNVLKYGSLTAVLTWVFATDLDFNLYEKIYFASGGIVFGLNIILMLSEAPPLHDLLTNTKVISEAPETFDAQTRTVSRPTLVSMGILAGFFLMIIAARGYVKSRQEFKENYMRPRANAFSLQTLVETYAYDEKQYPQNLQELYSHATKGPKPYWRSLDNPFYEGKETYTKALVMEDENPKPKGSVSYQPTFNGYAIYAYNRRGNRYQYKGRDLILTNSD